MLITREWLREKGACYKYKKIDKLAAGRPSITINELLELPIPNQDKIWVLLRFVTKKQLEAFMDSCVSATTKYNELVARYAELAAKYADHTRYASYIGYTNLAVVSASSVAVMAAAAAAIGAGTSAGIKERKRQLNWLKEALNVNR